MLEVTSPEPRPHLPQAGEKPELSRRGFIITYPMFRYWNREALDQEMEPKPLNVYVHMPYCIQRCAYCWFKTTTLKENRLKQIDHYVEALCKELALASRHYHLKERPVETIYFGGGTPTLMSEDNLERVFETIYENFTLANPQITVEGEPVTLTERKAALLKRHNVNRISLGIQSFKEEIVFQTGRRDTEEQAMRAIELAKSTGADVNIDLISGLAGETEETWAYSVKRALEADVHNITIYKLELYANTPYYSAEKNQEISLPDDDQELEFIKYAISELKKANYQAVNTFTFTRDGAYDQLHTRSKWLGNDNCATGVSSFGSIGTWNYQNLNDIASYTKSVESGKLPAFRGYNCSSFDMMIRDVVMGMKLVRFNHVEFQKKHGLNLVQACRPVLSQLEEEGFVGVGDEEIALTDQGIIYGDYVGRCLEGALRGYAGTAAKSRARVLF